MKITRNRLRKIIREVTGGAPERVSFDIPIPKDLEDIHARLKYAGRELFLVGGAVRDALMGKSPKDYDVATNASPEEVIKILQRDSSLRLDLTGKQFGVVRVKTKDDGEYEIATFREDIGKGKGTSVKFSTIENDVKRRDLTINALFYDMDSGEVVDYVGGIKDIEDGVIRAVGEPGQRFDEDRIRILRAIRFAGRMGSDLDPSTKEAILEDNQLIDTETGQPIPADRITEEFVKGLKSSADVSHFLSLTDELGMFDQLLPGLEIETQGGVTQDHIAQIAGLLRNNSSDLVVPTLKRMRYSNDESKTIKFLLDLMSLNRDTAAGLKKNFNRLNINPEHLHNFAEITGTPSEAVVRGFLEFAAAPPAGNPKDLMAQGLKGPEIGQAMAAAEAEAYSDFIGEVRNYIREYLILEAEEDIIFIEADIVTDTAGAKYYIGDIMTDIRGMRNVITATHSPAIKLNSGAEKFNLNIKFENQIDVDIPTLEKQMQAAPGIKRVDILTVDGQPYTKEMGDLDYAAARSDRASKYAEKSFQGVGAYDWKEKVLENSLRSYVRKIIEANEYEWSTASKRNMMLDKEGMEQSDKDEQEKFLKSMSLMEGLLLEQEVKFSGILKIMPSTENVALIESLIPSLPAEAIPLSSDRFHVTLIHQSVLKPFRKTLKQMNKDGSLPAPPPVVLETNIEHREAGDRQSWVLWVANQDQLLQYVNQVMEIVGGPIDPEPDRVFHVTVANLTGNPGDSVK